MAEARAIIPLPSGYDDEFVNALEEDLLCSICKFPLKKAVQIQKCGHRFCRQCLDQYFESLEVNRQPLICPEDRNKLMRDKDIFFDKATERKILSLRIKCPSKGCLWSGELRSKSDHLSSCPLKIVSCTNKNCSKTMTRNSLQKHVTAMCPWRIVRCIHCSTSHPECKTEDHLSSCPLKIVSCTNENCSKIMTRNSLQEHVTRKCPWRIVRCTHCSTSYPECKTEAHQADCKKSPLNCPKSCGAVIPREEGDLPENHESNYFATNSNTFSGIFTSEGGMVDGNKVRLVCPPGAVDNPVPIKMTLKDPSNFHGLLSERDLEKDVMVVAPIVNLQPSGYSFKKPLTLETTLEIKDFDGEKVVIIHGTEERDGKIIWLDITHNAKIVKTKKMAIIEIEHFSPFVILFRRNLIIRPKDIVYRLNVWAFHYTLSALVKKSDISSTYKLALLFVSKDVFHEQFYREDDTSALVQLKKEGFRELHVRPFGEQERIYFKENLLVNIHLGEDYHLADSQDGSTCFNVQSDAWWGAGEVVKRPLECNKAIRCLCGKVTVQGEYGHLSKWHFSEQDLIGYVRSLLDVNGAIFNLIPIAQSLEIPDEESLNRIIKHWRDEDGQLYIILKHYIKNRNLIEELALLRKRLEDLKREDYKVTHRGQMHIRNVREFALQISYSDSRKVGKLFNSVLQDCCIELENSMEGVKIAASSANHADYLINYFTEHHRPIPEDIARKYRKLYLSFEKPCTTAFWDIAPYLIQNIKEIFVDREKAVPQNGLWGLSDKKLRPFLTNVLNVEITHELKELVYKECRLLEELCRKNHDKQATGKIKKWSEKLEISKMLKFLKRKQFFQYCQQDVRLYERLKQFSCCLRDTLLANHYHMDEFFMRDLSNLLLSLVDFSKFDPSKLVRFEVTDSSHSPLSCSRESVVYDKHTNTFSQMISVRKESEGELQLHANAYVNMDGQICKKGALQSVIQLNPSFEEVFDKLMDHFSEIAVMKTNDKASESLRIVLCAMQKEKLLEALDAFKYDLSEDVLDMSRSQVTQCHLTMRFIDRLQASEKTARLRLLYKWGSEAISLDSKDFVTFADCSAGGACMPEVKLLGLDDDLAVEGAAALSQPSIMEKFALSSFDQLQRHGRIQCEKIEYHLHQTVNQMSGHVCVAGDKATVNEQMPTERALQNSPSCASRKRITDGKRC